MWRVRAPTLNLLFPCGLTRIDAISVDKSILTGYVSSSQTILDYSFKKLIMVW